MSTSSSQYHLALRFPLHVTKSDSVAGLGHLAGLRHLGCQGRLVVACVLSLYSFGWSDDTSHRAGFFDQEVDIKQLLEFAGPLVSLLSLAGG